MAEYSLVIAITQTQFCGHTKTRLICCECKSFLFEVFISNNIRMSGMLK